MVDTSGIPRAMTLIYLVAAARKDATPEQVDQLGAAVDRLKAPVAEGGASMGEVAQRVFEVMGPDWAPAEEWLVAMEAMIDKPLPRPTSSGRVGQTSEDW